MTGPTIQTGILDDLLGYAIRQAQIRVYADFFDAVGDDAITPQRFTALTIIGENPGLQQTQIAQAMGVARPGATALIDFWEDRGCLERRSAPNDRRSYGIYLTRQGEETLGELQETVLRHDQDLTKAMSTTDRGALMALLKTFNASAS